MLLEAEVHSQLRAFSREQDQRGWSHHLTMGRLVARALRLGRPALIQTGTAVEQYALSYLTPALLHPESVIIVAPKSVQQRLLQTEIPQLQHRLGTQKEIRQGDYPLEDNFTGILLTSPQSWLADRFYNQGRFPTGIPTLIEAADHLEDWARKQLTATLGFQDWEQLLRSFPHQVELIRNVRIQITKAIFARPQNPYGCYLLEKPEQERLERLWQTLEEIEDGKFVNSFWQKQQSEGQILWASVDREQGQWSLHISPGSVAESTKSIWLTQPVVIIGSFLDWESDATIYRQQLGLSDILCLKFAPDRQKEHIQIYLPDRLPLPNTPQFQPALIEQVRQLSRLSSRANQFTVLLVEDVPLKAQIGAIMAAEFGSKVQVEKTILADNGILVCGWQFWRSHQEQLPTPGLLVIATLPLPSLENPLVAGRVAYYKRRRQDWFRLYLLPTALREIQRAVIPLRESQGVVAPAR